MKQLHIEIDFKYKQDGKRVTETRTYERSLEDFPIVLLEMGEMDNLREARQAMADFLDLSNEEERQLTLGHIKRITEAISAAQEIPNE